MNNLNESLKEKAMTNGVIDISYESNSMYFDFEMTVNEFYICDGFYFLEDENDNMFQFKVDKYEYDYDRDTFIVESDDGFKAELKM